MKQKTMGFIPEEAEHVEIVNDELAVSEAPDTEGRENLSESDHFSDVHTPFLVRVNTPYLNVRTGPGTDWEKTGKYTGVGIFTIVAVKPGEGSDSGWGLLEDTEDEWISLDVAERL